MGPTFDIIYADLRVHFESRLPKNTEHVEYVARGGREGKGEARRDPVTSDK